LSLKDSDGGYEMVNFIGVPHAQSGLTELQPPGAFFESLPILPGGVESS
jgi:hypothetical protein